MIEVIALVSTLLLTPTPPPPTPTPTPPPGAPPGWFCGTPAPPPPTSDARWYYSLPVCTPAPRPTRTPAVVLPTVHLPTVVIPRLPLNATPTITPTPSPTPTLTPTPTPAPPPGGPALWLRVGVGDFGYQDYPLPHLLDISGSCGSWSAGGGISSSDPRVRVHSQEVFTLTAEFSVEYSVCASRDHGCDAVLAGQAQTENVIRVTVPQGQCASGTAAITLTAPARYSTLHSHYYVPDLVAGAVCEWSWSCSVNFNKTIRFYNIPPPPDATPTPTPTPTPTCVPCRPIRTDLPPVADWEIVVEPGVCTTLLPAFQIPLVNILGWEVGGVGWDAVRICPRWVHVRASLAGVDLALLLGAAVALGSVWLIVRLAGGL